MKDNRDHQTMDPLSEWLNNHPEAEPVPEPELEKNITMKPYVRPIPFPQRLRKHKHISNSLNS